MRGRHSAGTGIIGNLLGSAEAKLRLETILRTLAGECGVEEACAILGLGERRFHAMRHEALQATLDRLALRPPGRPVAPPIDPETNRLRREISELRQELAAARAREEIALVLPRLAARAEGGKRKGRRKGARRS
ncbi:MAG: hypothetical protein K2W96_00640 [Gemmataceae bacterium]|nr:hypothetical protein [Gemmataceae bacterium]